MFLNYGILLRINFLNIWNINIRSNIFQRYKDKKKFAKVINNETYLIPIFLSVDLINTKNKAPINGKIIKDERIGNILFNN